MDDDSNDSAWELLARGRTIEPKPGFVEKLATLARQTSQISSYNESPGMIQMFTSAPPQWRAAAAALVLSSTALIGISVFSNPHSTATASATVTATDIAELPAEHVRAQADVHLGLRPLDDVLASEELDALLEIDDSESLEDEDLLLLLVPDWELL